MNETTKTAVEELKQIPAEIRERVQEGTERFLEQVRQPFEEPATSADARPQHVVPREGKWAVLPQGVEEATALFDTKQEAFEAARETARNNDTMLIVHRQDGTVQETRNYRSD